MLILFNIGMNKTYTLYTMYVHMHESETYLCTHFQQMVSAACHIYLLTLSAWAFGTTAGRGHGGDGG